MKPNEILKAEIAQELGLWDKIEKSGWKSLSSKESGRIGGILSGKKKAQKRKENSQSS